MTPEPEARPSKDPSGRDIARTAPAPVGGDLGQLLTKLESLPRGITLAQARMMLRGTASAPMAEATRRCALPRWFDAALYEHLCEGIEQPPAFDELVGGAPVQRLAAGRWALEDETRSRLLVEWQQQPETWREWNGRLAAMFQARDAADDRLDVIYHLAASPRPDAAVKIFRQWYAEADRAFDLAQCNALLEMLRLQAAWRGPALSRQWREYRQYHRARMLFADDYYKTGSYLHRSEPLRVFNELLKPGARSPSDPWIFHLHATGGTGKTMFLRWLISRNLVPRRVGCARVDFDDFRLRDAVDHPLRLFVGIVDHWSQQVEGTALSSLLEKLVREQQHPGWNPGMTEELRRQLLGSGVAGPLVVVLDTLEEATLAAAEWLAQCIAELRRVHELVPGLTLVLSGRYDIAARTRALLPGEWVGHELPRFSVREAHRYLAQRGVSDERVREAIVARCGEETAVTKGTLAPQRDRNPFKLGIFAELALGRRTLTPEEVARFPRADLAYLIERVIKRIEAQPLRWVIRYGAIARHLTPSFLDEVLIPVLRRVLQGELADDTTEGIEGYDGVWLADRTLAATLDAGTLWPQLQAYARERGWISTIGSGTASELRFHPDVVVPMRDLLRGKPVVTEIHARAIDYYGKQAADPVRDEPVDARVRRLCDELFHRFQLQGPAAGEAWREAVRRAERWGYDAALRVATEVLGRDYAEGERTPIAGVASPATLFAAHCEAAELSMRRSAWSFSELHGKWDEFRRHVDLASAIAREDPGAALAMPPALRGIRDALGEPDGARRVASLRAALDAPASMRDRVMLCLALARQLALQRSTEAAVFYREALRLLPEAPRTVQATGIHLALAGVYEFEGAHAAVVAAQRSALAGTATGTRRRRDVLSLQAVYALETGDLSGAIGAIARLESEYGTAPDAAPPPVRLLRARLALIEGDPARALHECAAGLQDSPTNDDRARLLDQCGEAYAVLLEFAEARRHWGLAASAYDAHRGDLSVVGPARCAFLDAQMTALLMEDLDTAASLIDSASRLRGMRDARLFAELQLLSTYVSLRRGQPDLAQRLYARLLEPRRPEWPAPLRARVLVFGLLFGLLTEDDLPEVLECLAAVQPLTRRDDLLDWAQYADHGVPIDANGLAGLLALFALPRPPSPRVVPAYRDRADVCRVLGHAAHGCALLGRVEQAWTPGHGSADALRLWELNRARHRAGLEPDYVSVLDLIVASDVGDRAIGDAVRIEAMQEAVRRGEAERGAALRRTGFSRIRQQPHSVWIDRIDGRRPYFATARRAGGTEGPSRSLGQDHAVETQDQPVVVSAEAVPEAVLAASRHLELAIDRMMGDWAGFAAELGHALLAAGVPSPAPHVVRVIPRGGLAALPWELAPLMGEQAMVCRTSEPLAARDLPPWSVRHGHVHIVRPSGLGSEIGDIVYESVSGATLESLYAEAGMPYRVSMDPHPSQLQQLFMDEPPSVVHVVASLRDTSAGVCLDFQEARARAKYLARESLQWQGQTMDLPLVPDVIERKLRELAQQQGGLEDVPLVPEFVERRLRESPQWQGGTMELLFTPTRFDDTLSKMPQPPWVVLDIASPTNLAEAVRMLLLRNTFASQLFGLGHVRGVLACGLAPPEQRFDVTREVVFSLIRGGPRRVVGALRRELSSLGAGGEGSRLENALPRSALGVWAANPRDAEWVDEGGPA